MILEDLLQYYFITEWLIPILLLGIGVIAYILIEFIRYAKDEMRIKRRVK